MKYGYQEVLVLCGTWYCWGGSFWCWLPSSKQNYTCIVMYRKCHCCEIMLMTETTQDSA